MRLFVVVTVRRSIALRRRLALVRDGQDGEMKQIPMSLARVSEAVNQAVLVLIARARAIGCDGRQLHHSVRQSGSGEGFSAPLPFARLGYETQFLGRPKRRGAHERIDKLRHVLSKRECDDKKTSDQERIKPMHICCLLSFNHLFRQPSLEKVYCKAKKEGHLLSFLFLLPVNYLIIRFSRGERGVACCAP